MTPTARDLANARRIAASVATGADCSRSILVLVEFAETVLAQRAIDERAAEDTRPIGPGKR